jgi:hypothetical protein
MALCNLVIKLLQALQAVNGNSSQRPEKMFAPALSGSAGIA